MGDMNHLRGAARLHLLARWHVHVNALAKPDERLLIAHDVAGWRWNALAGRSNPAERLTHRGLLESVDGGHCINEQCARQSPRIARPRDTPMGASDGTLTNGATTRATRADGGRR